MSLNTLIKAVSVGFILGILFAPDKGSATRRRISGITSDIKDDMADTFDDITSIVSEKISDIKNMVSNMTDKAKDEFGDIMIDDEERI